MLIISSEGKCSILGREGTVVVEVQSWRVVDGVGTIYCKTIGEPQIGGGRYHLK